MLDGKAGRFATGKDDGGKQQGQDRLPGAQEEPCLHVRVEDFQDRKLLLDQLLDFARLKPVL
jgi:hypothetical protein